MQISAKVSTQVLFDGKVKDEGVEVIVIEDSQEPSKPDAIFPNNWISFHEDGKTPFSDVIMYAYHTDIKGKYTRAGNDQLTWKTNKKTDIGFSFGLLNTNEPPPL